MQIYERTNARKLLAEAKPKEEIQQEGIEIKDKGLLSKIKSFFNS